MNDKAREEKSETLRNPRGEIHEGARGAPERGEANLRGAKVGGGEARRGRGRVWVG